MANWNPLMASAAARCHYQGTLLPSDAMGWIPSPTHGIWRSGGGISPLGATHQKGCGRNRRGNSIDGRPTRWRRPSGGTEEVLLTPSTLWGDRVRP